MSATDQSGRTDKPATGVTVVGDGPLAQAVRVQAAGVASSGETAAAHVMLVDHGDDTQTIRAMHEVLDRRSPNASPLIVAQIADRALRRAVSSRVEQDGITPRPIIVDVSTMMAEHFVSTERLFEIADWRGQPRLHVALVGFGPLGQAFFDVLVTAGIAGALARPLIHIVTPNEAAARAFLQREMPEIGESVEIVISACATGDLGDPVCSPLVEKQGSAPLTAIMLLLEDAGDTLRASAAIAQLQDRDGFGQAALFIGGPGSAEACALVTPRRPPHNLGRKIARIDDIAAIERLLDYIVGGRDALARQFHEAYLAQYAGKTGAGTPWDSLGETYRRANRRAAAHLDQKLWTIGLSTPDDVHLSGTVGPAAYANVIQPLAASSAEDDVMRRLARLEHERWCADRRLDGWEYGDVRDDTRRRHPSLVPFDDPRLTADEIGKDIAQVRFLFGSVVRAEPNGAATRFVTGVIAALGHTQPGVSVEAVRDQLAREPDRYAIIVSPLLTRNEIATVAALLAALDAQGRDCLVIVPEWYPDNKTLRDEALLRDPQLLRILARPQTRIAPVGPPGFFRDDVWEDPTGTDTACLALSDYIMQRAQAVILVDRG
jgi:hypothetical protein